MQITAISCTVKDAEDFLKRRYPEKTFGPAFAPILSRFAAEKVAEMLRGIRIEVAATLERLSPNGGKKST